MKKRFLSLLCALALCLGLLPVTALAAAPNGQVIYVGNENVTSGGYWTTDSAGNVTQYNEEGKPSNNYIHYNTATNTLTLHNATIKESVSMDTSTFIAGAAIGVLNQSGNAELTITLEGTNTIAEVGKGIYVLTNSTGGATLTITGDGSLDASASQTAIWVQSNSNNASLDIQNAKVEATGTSTAGYGVNVQSSNSSTASLSVDGGSLTASGSPGILYDSIGSGTVPDTTALTISNSAIVDARGGGIGAGLLQDLKKVSPADASVGIVFDGNQSTVYGDVILQEDLTIGEGESLTLDAGASLNADRYHVIVDGGTLDEDLANSLGSSVKYAPTITTQPTSQTVTEGGTATFVVVTNGTEPLSYRWQQSTDSGRSWTDIGGATDATYITEATTTSMNGYQYRCVVSNSAGSITSDAVSLTVNEHVHTWGNPVWSWSEDGKTCTVTFTCEKDENHKESPKVDVTSAVKKPATCTETGVTTYTATVEFNGQTYTDAKEVADIPATGHRYENGKCTVCGGIDPSFKAMIIEGANGKWQKGSEGGLPFTSNASFADFLKVQVDGKDVDASNYTVKEGSTIVALNASYLETLSAGKHTLAIVSDIGTAETEFTVLAAEGEAADSKAANDGDKESLAETGDGSMLPIAALSILAMVSAAAGALSLRRIRL